MFNIIMWINIKHAKTMYVKYLLLAAVETSVNTIQIDATFLVILNIKNFLPFYILISLEND